MTSVLLQSTDSHLADGEMKDDSGVEASLEPEPPNPFSQLTDQELEEYKKEVERKKLGLDGKCPGAVIATEAAGFRSLKDCNERRKGQLNSPPAQRNQGTFLGCPKSWWVETREKRLLLHCLCFQSELHFLLLFCHLLPGEKKDSGPEEEVMSPEESTVSPPEQSPTKPGARSPARSPSKAPEGRGTFAAETSGNHHDL